MVKSRAKTGSELVASSQDKLRESGGGRFPTLTLGPEEMALWEQLRAKHGGEGKGSAKRTLMAALRSLDTRRELSKAELIAIIAARIR